MSEIDVEVQTQLGVMVTDYHKYDTAEKSAKKLKEPLNKDLKVLMSKSKLKEFVIDDLTASYALQERTSMNSDKLLQRLKDLGFDKAIETFERPNAGVLEALIYDGELDPELIKDCNETKWVEVLSVKKMKKKAGTK